MNERGVESAEAASSKGLLVQYSAAARDDEANLVDIWQILMSHKWLILSLTLLSAAVAAVYALRQPEMYKAEIVVAPVSDTEGNRLSALAWQLGGLAPLAGVNIPSSGTATDTAIAVLQSRAFTDAFIRELNLMPILFPESWDARRGAWRKGEDRTFGEAYSLFNQNIRSVVLDKKTGLVTISIEWVNPEQAAQWANLLVQRVNKHQQIETVTEAEKSIAYLREQLTKTNLVEMQQAIYRLIESQTKNIMLANVRDEFVFKVIDPAVVPDTKSKPNKKLIVVLGVGAGFACGVLIALFLSQVRSGARR